MTCSKSGEPSISDASGGGSTALSGFLYQMLVALGLSGHGSMHREIDHDSALLSLTGGASVVHEGYDGDVALLHNIQETAKKGVVLVQCKFSKSGTDSEIGPKEFKGILNRLFAAAKSARGDGRTVTGFFLVTNRKCSQGSDKIRKEVANTGKSGELNKIQNCIAGQLTIEPPSEPEFWEQKLAELASNYGLLPAEYGAGKQRLLGRLLESTGASAECEVSREMLVECLTNSRVARPLAHSFIQGHLEAELNRLGTMPSHPVITRPTAESALAMYSNRALIVCTGQGGTGKSAALREWSRRESQRSFIAIRRPSSVTADWIGAQIQQWREIHGPSDNPDTALERLGLANPDMLPPLLLLCLDGIDERVAVGSHTQYLSSILEWFWSYDERTRVQPASRPRAKLIVTCRHIKDFEQFWTPNTSGSPEAEPELPPLIEFGDFDDDEFASILQASSERMSDEVFTRLLPTGSGSTATAEVDFTAFGGSGRHSTIPDSPARILRHPAMWEAFMALPKDTMLAVLNGEPSAEEKLAERYVQRFFRKAGARSFDLVQETVEIAFIKIAVATMSLAPRAKYSRSLWYGTIGNELSLGVPFADKLLSEAMSSGLVIGDYDAWVWRFAFVQRYLTSKEKAQ